MFTGIVQDVGRIERCEARGGDLRLVIACDRLDMRHVQLGDSVSVQGCCLTATEVHARAFAADVSRETLALTTLGDLAPGAPVNLEPALRTGDPLGGHLVSGHVDGVAQVLALGGDARSQRLVIGARKRAGGGGTPMTNRWDRASPPPLARFLAPKGSVAVDGVSL